MCGGWYERRMSPAKMAGAPIHGPEQHDDRRTIRPKIGTRAQAQPEEAAGPARPAGRAAPFRSPESADDGEGHRAEPSTRGATRSTAPPASGEGAAASRSWTLDVCIGFEITAHRQYVWRVV
eukprot:15470297-Alexandrium_andersonii.AAC.1